MNKKAVQEGVSDAFLFWLETHPLTVGEDIIGEAVKVAVKKWLDDNEDVIVAAVANGKYH